MIMMFLSMKLSPVRHLQKGFTVIKKEAQAGFTLIELLVVIGILGILAAALVATIDPFEQLNKATDARTENTLVEFQNALLRYYTIRGVLPWNESTNPCSTAPVGTDTIYSLSDCLTALVTQGELKGSFTTATGTLSEIYVNEGNTNDITSCYMPISKSKQRDPNAQFTQDGQTATGCTSQGASGTSCYWCTR